VDAFLFSALAVAVAELGDKTQLLAFVLAARFGKPLPIVMGVLLATLGNHALAGMLGAWLGEGWHGPWLRFALGGSFLAMALWLLVPDKPDAPEAQAGRLGPFLVTLIAFFVAEMGDKTQVATIALAAHYRQAAAVVLGTTLGMMAVNVPSVLLGRAVLKLVPLRLTRPVAALLFVALGTAAMLG